MSEFFFFNLHRISKPQTHLVHALLLFLDPVNVQQDVPHLPPDRVRDPLVHPVDHLLPVLGLVPEELLLLFDHLGPLETARDLVLDLALLALGAPAVREALVAGMGKRGC